MNLQEFVKQQDLTVEKLKEKSKLGESTIKRSLKGENLNANSMDKLAEALEISKDELKALIQAPPSSDYIAVLVHQQLHTLNALSLEFQPSRKQPDMATYLSIEQDICGDLSYFPNEFKKQVNKAGNKNQLNALKELVLYCTAYLLDRSGDIDLNTTSLLSLRGGDNAWELRLHINTAIQQMENLEFKLIQCADTGVTKLAPVVGAYQFGLSASTDPMELLLNIVRQINAQEKLTDIPCPEQLRQGNQQDFGAFETHCEDLNSHIKVLRNWPDNVFAFDQTPIPDQLASKLEQYLPALRVMIIQADDGEPFLRTGHKIHAVLINLLKLVVKRENELFGTVVNDEVNNMAGSTTINFNGDVRTASVGNNNQIIIGTKLNEILPLLQEMQSMLASNSSSDEMRVLDEAINANPQAPQDAIKKIDNALQTAKKLVRQGTRVADLYNKADALFQQLTTLL